MCETERSYRIVGLSPAVTLIIEIEGERRDTNETAPEWVELEDLKPGKVFDYYTRAEKVILRRGHREVKKRKRRPSALD